LDRELDRGVRQQGAFGPARAAGRVEDERAACVRDLAAPIEPLRPAPADVGGVGFVDHGCRGEIGEDRGALVLLQGRLRPRAGGGGGGAGGARSWRPASSAPARAGGLRSGGARRPRASPPRRASTAASARARRSSSPNVSAPPSHSRAGLSGVRREVASRRRAKLSATARLTRGSL